MWATWIINSTSGPLPLLQKVEGEAEMSKLLIMTWTSG